MLFPVVIHKDKNSSYGVTIPDIPGCFSAGDTMDETLANIQEAVEVHLDGETRIPVPSGIETHMDNPDYAGGTWVLVDLDLSFMNGKAVRINVTIPENLLKYIDRAVSRLGTSRSQFLTESARKNIPLRYGKIVGGGIVYPIGSSTTKHDPPGKLPRAAKSGKIRPAAKSGVNQKRKAARTKHS